MDPSLQPKNSVWIRDYLSFELIHLCSFFSLSTKALLSVYYSKHHILLACNEKIHQRDPSLPSAKKVLHFLPGVIHFTPVSHTRSRGYKNKEKGARVSDLRECRGRRHRFKTAPRLSTDLYTFLTSRVLIAGPPRVVGFVD